VPTIKDRAFFELALRKGEIPADKLEQGKAAQKELEKFGISKPLPAILVEKSIASKEAVTAIAEEMNTFSIRCQSCGRPSPLSEADRNGSLKCKQCSTLIEHSEERISEDDLSPGLKTGNRGRGEGRAGKPKQETRQGHQGHQGQPASHAHPPAAGGGWETRRLGNGAQDDLIPRREVTKFKLEKFVGVSPGGKLYQVSDGGARASVKVLDRVLCADKAQFKKWVDFMQRVQDLPLAISLKPVQLFKEGSTNYTSRPFIGEPESSLSARLASHDAELLSAEGARECAIALLRSLQQFHAAHFVHGNLKPSNVVLTEDGACLTDPGLNILFDGLPREDRAARLSDVARYTAPEVLQGSESTPASDVFSAGKILEDLLAALATVKDAKHALAPVIAWLSPIASRMAAPDPTERPPSAKEALRELDGIKRDGVTTRVAPAVKAPSKVSATTSWVREKLGVQLVGHALLVLAVVVVFYQFTGWYKARKAFASPGRGDELTQWIISREIADLSRSTASEGGAAGESQKRWDDLTALFQGTAWEEKVRAASAEALGRLQDSSEQDLATAVAEARASADKRDWTAALQALLRVESRIERSGEARELFEKVVDGLFEDEHMVFVPRAASKKGEKASQDVPGPFLVDVSLARRKGGGDAPCTSISFEEAEKLAQAAGKRLPTGAEWDRMVAFAREKSPSWAAGKAAKIENIDGKRGSFFEWVAGGEEDDLARAAYGYCRGGDRAGAPPTHPLRRKKNTGHADVSVRFVRSLKGSRAGN
jgi:hypothetical protein